MFALSQAARPVQRPRKTLRRPTRTTHRLLGFAAVAGLMFLNGCGPLGLERGNAETGKLSTPGGDAVAVIIEGDSISFDELHQYMQDQFLEEFLRQPAERRFEMEESAIRDMVQRRVVQAAAQERGLSEDELFDEITRAAPEPSVEDVANWYSQNQSRLRGARLEDVAGQIKDMLANEARGAAWASFIGPRVDALSWKMVIDPPRKELRETRLVRGDIDAPVTLMTFSDYQCPYCIRSEPVIAEVLERYPGRVRLIHRHFPLDRIHPFARPAAEAAMCADEQGQFWAFHDAIFERKGKLEEGSLREIGERLGLDEEAFDRCVEERRYEDFVQADFDAGQAAGVTGTPAFFVNGIALKGARDADELSRIIDSELERIEAN